MADVQQVLEQRFSAAMAGLGAEATAADPLVRPAGNPQHGDYQANAAMGLAKKLSRKPREVAQEIVAKLAVGDLAEKVEIAGPGFINVRLKGEFVARQAEAMATDERLGVEPASAAQTVVVDYSCPNVAKEMHVGHLRSTVIGDALVRVLEFLGHRVIRQNHLGDWGTQFGMLIEHLLEQGWRGEGQSIGDLNALYKQAQDRYASDEAFAERARRRVVALQKGEAEERTIWQKLIDESMRHFQPLYERLDVLLRPQDVRGESFYNPMLPGVVEELLNRGLAQISDGAACVFLPEFKDAEGKPSPMIIRKSDGGYLYATTDLAAVRYRVGELGAQRLIYVTDARQTRHYQMMFATAQLAGWLPPEVRAEHVAFGTILGKDGKPFKTREGGVVKLADLLDEAEQRAAAILQQKDPDLSEEERRAVAHAVGIGALKYGDLSSDRIKDYVFDWERMLAFEGNTAPYLQNAHVRIQSIFRKGNIARVEAGPIPVAEAAERALAMKLLQFPATVRAVGQSLEPHRLCTYLFDLAALFHQFYERCPVLAAGDEAVRLSRLRLCELTARVLCQGLALLGIAAPARM